jgi:hypothetical protein
LPGNVGSSEKPVHINLFLLLQKMDAFNRIHNEEAPLLLRERY